MFTWNSQGSHPNTNTTTTTLSWVLNVINQLVSQTTRVPATISLKLFRYLTRPLGFTSLPLLALSSLSGVTAMSRAYTTGRYFTATEQGEYRDVGICDSGKLICPWLYTIWFQYVSKKRERFHLVWWSLWLGYYSPNQWTYISSNEMDLHPWEERISSHLDGSVIIW